MICCHAFIVAPWKSINMAGQQHVPFAEGAHMDICCSLIKGSLAEK